MLLQVFSLILLGAIANAANPVVVCYYGSWATYRPWPGTYDVADINANRCTHLVYAFAGMNAQSLLVESLDPYNDLEENWGKGSYKKFTALAAANPGVKALLAVGGWNEGSTKYSSMAVTSAGRKRFAESAVEFLQRYGFGGLDLDWEYPTMRGGRPEDKENFVLLLKELHTQLQSAGLLLTVAAGASLDMVGSAYDVPGIAENVDLINLMTFDYYTGDSYGSTSPHAPLNPLSEGGQSVKSSVDRWVQAGAPKNKLVVAVPFYARTFHLRSADNHDIGAPSDGVGTAGPITLENGFLSYYELCMKQQDEGWTVETKDGNVYSYKGQEWASYDNEAVIKNKAQYILDEGLAGAMVWSLESDDSKGVCGGETSPLLAALNRGLGRL